MSERSAHARSTAALVGAWVGDGLSWPAMRHRLSLQAPKRLNAVGRTLVFDAEKCNATMALPHIHSSPPELTNYTGPACTSEWLTVSLLNLTGRRLDGSAASEPNQIWKDLAEERSRDQDRVRGRIGTNLALANLAQGHNPPLSGAWNAHYFDDLVLVRALAAAIVEPGDPGRAAELAEQDSQVTNSLDGIWCARAASAMFSTLLSGGDAESAIGAALRELPAGSWSETTVNKIVDLSANAGSQLALARTAEREVVDQIYSYAVCAPETLGLLLGHLRLSKTADDLLLATLSHPRHADTLVALAGAVAGILHGTDWAAVGDGELELQGTNVRALAGTRLNTLLPAAAAA